MPVTPSPPLVIRRGLVAVAAVLLVAASALAPVGPGGPAGAAVPGPVPEGEWVVSTPEAHGMDPAVLDGARDYAFADGKNTQGVVVVRGGEIVTEWYAPGAGPDSWAASWSMAKSMTSALVGIAIDEGAISGVDVPMTTYFPEFRGTPREAMTLRHVLQMESGLDWFEGYDPAGLGESQVIDMVLFQPDQLAFAASRPARVPPGTWWSYSSGDTMLLSGVLEQATGMPVHDYARSRLFAPLGIDQVDWWTDAVGHTLTYCCVDTTSRDFARFGLLYLRGGEWGSEQVVPGSWVEDSLAPTVASGGSYGYQWWLGGDDDGPRAGAFSARGHDNQYIYVFPALDLVVVRNGTYGKSPCPPVADPNLFGRYPSAGLVPGEGTVGADWWDDEAFLAPIIESITGTAVPLAGTALAAPAPRVAASAPPASAARQAPEAQADPCAPPDDPDEDDVDDDRARPAVPVAAPARFTG